jgi:hypothetical protein
VRSLARHQVRAAAPAVAVALAARLTFGAQPCPAEGQDWVLLVTEPDENPALANRLLEHLRAELRPRGIAVCPAAGATAAAPLGTIRVTHPSSNTVVIRVTVEDAVTEKNVSRNLELGSLPPDAHPLTIALGAAELLRASWAEITLKDAPPPSRPVPPVVSKTVTDALRSTPDHGHLGLSLAGEEFEGGLRLGGLDGRLVLALVDRWSLTARIGVRDAPATKAADGRIQASAWIAGLGTMAELTAPSSRARVGLLGRLDVTGIHFLAEPRGHATGTSTSGTAVTAGGGITGSVQFGKSIELEAEIVAGGVIRGVTATDGGNRVVGASGVWVGASAGVGVRF